MRIATWNINSIRTRVDRVVDWLHAGDIDVLALQETKCRNDQFPLDALEAAGYEVIAHGLNQWNGVAFVSRIRAENVAIGFPGMPGFSKGDDAEPPLEARAIGATFDGVRLWSLYVPNGRSLDDPHFEYKLHWLDALRTALRPEITTHPELAIMGDFNIAPLDEDCGDPRMIPGQSTHISPVERESFNQFETLGLHDCVRPRVPTGYTYWDYKNLAFPETRGFASISFSGLPVSRTVLSMHTLIATSVKVTNPVTMFPSWWNFPHRMRTMTDRCSGSHT